MLQLPEQLQQYDTQLRFLVAINFQLQRLLYTITTQLQHNYIYNSPIATHGSHNYNITTPELQHIPIATHVSHNYNIPIATHMSHNYNITTTELQHICAHPTLAMRSPHDFQVVHCHGVTFGVTKH